MTDESRKALISETLDKLDACERYWRDDSQRTAVLEQFAATLLAQNEAVALLRVLLDKGSWYLSAIELDGWDDVVNGEELRKQAERLVRLAGQ